MVVPSLNARIDSKATTKKKKRKRWGRWVKVGIGVRRWRGSILRQLSVGVTLHVRSTRGLVIKVEGTPRPTMMSRGGGGGGGGARTPSVSVSRDTCHNICADINSFASFVSQKIDSPHATNNRATSHTHTHTRAGVNLALGRNKPNQKHYAAVTDKSEIPERSLSRCLIRTRVLQRNEGTVLNPPVWLVIFFLRVSEPKTCQKTPIFNYSDLSIRQGKRRNLFFLGLRRKLLTVGCVFRIIDSLSKLELLQGPVFVKMKKGD